MKKYALFLIVIFMLLCLTACGSPDTTSTTEPESQETAEPTSDNSGVIDNRTTEEDATEDQAQQENASFSDDDFTKEAYMYENRYGDTFYFLAITNNSNASVEIGANGIAKDATGNMIGADDFEIDVLGPGEQSIGYFVFDDVSGVASVDYDINYAASSYYDPVIADLELQYTINNQNVVVSVTNNGDKKAEYVKAYALFFDANGGVVDYDSGYVVDNDNELKPGKTLVEQLDTRDGFDNVKVFLSGRRYNR